MGKPAFVLPVREYVVYCFSLFDDAGGQARHADRLSGLRYNPNLFPDFLIIQPLILKMLF